jgi:deoxyadenosine/deoxycytidine kinase
MKKYTLIVHLDVKPEEALTRIRERNYDYEKDITLDYLTKLYNAYEDFIQHISKAIPVIRVNYLKFKSVEEMARKIKEEYENMTNIKILEYSDSDDENGGN